MLGVDDLRGRSFFDIGSGSGLFSLAAWRLGARVHSFDYDPQSVACTEELRRRYAPGDGRWTVARGSALDAAYLRGLGQYDVVYSWGVLHHTGRMWEALDLALLPLAPGGSLFIAIYNDQGFVSSYWTVVKRLFNRGAAWRAAMIALHAPYLIGLRALVRAIAGRGRIPRGMTLWYDMLDWLGGISIRGRESGGHRVLPCRAWPAPRAPDPVRPASRMQRIRIRALRLSHRTVATSPIGMRSVPTRRMMSLLAATSKPSTMPVRPVWGRMGWPLALVAVTA